MRGLTRRQLRRLARPSVVRPRGPVAERAARAVGVLYVLVTLYYLYWRATASLNFDALWLAIPLLVAECYGFLNFGMFLFMVWRLSPPEELAPIPGAAVDVFITTYDEDVSILRATVLGCLAMTYPHKTYLLDDGRRPEVRRLAEELGCGYITRPDNAHAKAGNINHALKETGGELIAVFDADQVPHPDFLVQTLGYFQDERVALVQTPQEFYNLDSVQHIADPHRGPAWHEQRLFYSVIQAGKDRLNAAFWCGSNAVLRRSALEGIGGVATETVTEDIHTAMRLHQAGWRSRYVGRTLATGIAPPDYGAFFTQRLRWAQGAMQLLRSANPLFVRGLSWQQRINYWASMTTYFDSYQRVVYLAVPLVVLFTGILPMSSLGFGFLVRFIPYFVLGQVANSLLARGHGRHFLTEQFNLLKTLIFLWASLTLFSRRPLRFRVTPKTVADGQRRRKADLTLLSPYFVLVAVSVVAMSWGVGRVAAAQEGLGDRLAMYLTGVWAVYNVGVVALALRIVLGRFYRRRSYRFPVRLPVRFAVDRQPYQYLPTLTSDLNAEGASIVTPQPVDRGTPVRAVLQLADGPLPVAAIVTHSEATVGHRETTYRTGVRFTSFEPGGQDRLLRFLFGTVVTEQEAPPERKAA